MITGPPRRLAASLFACGALLGVGAAQERQGDDGRPPSTEPLVERPQLEPRPSTTLALQPYAKLSDEQLARCVAELLPMVERHAGRRFLESPKVRTADESSWARLVEAEIPDARDRALAAAVTMALYLPERDEVVIGPYVAGRLLDDEASSVGPRAVLAHELTHVLQDQHFALPSRQRAETDGWRKQALRALMEGHATLVEERVATELGAPNAEGGTRRRLRRGPGLVYLRGRDYLAAIEAEGGADAVVQALVGALPSPLEFARRSARPRAPEKGR